MHRLVKEIKKFAIDIHTYRYFILGVLLVIGAWIRFSGILSNSFAFTYDVGRDMLVLHQIVVDHKIPLIGPTTGLPGLFYGPWWYYLLTIPFLIVRGDPQGIALFMALLGMAAILLGYSIGKRIGGIFLGLIFSGILCFSPYFVGLSIQIWNPNIAPVLLLLLLFLFYPLFTDKPVGNPFALFSVGIILGLLLDTEIVFGMLLLASILIFFLVLKRNVLFKKQSLFALLGIFFTLLPRIFFELRHHFIMTTNFLHGFAVSSSEGANTPFLQTLLNRIVIYFNLFADTLTNGNKILAATLIVFCVMSIYFFSKKASPIQKAYLWLCVVVILTFFIGITIFSHAIWGHYLVGVPVFYVLIVCLAILFYYNAITLRLAPLIIVVILFWINLQPMQVIASALTPPWEGNAAVYRNQIAAIDYIYHDAKGKGFNYIVYTPAVYDFTYQYLFIWYGPKQYGYAPVTDRRDLFYVIIEPDVDSPWRITDWLKVREGDGKVVRSQVVKGGIIVQTRVR